MVENFAERESAKHVLGLDLIRFLAASMVVAYHFGFWHFTRPGGMLAGKLSPGAVSTISPFVNFGWVGVEIFFVISGYVIALSAQGVTAGQFAKGRFLRLVPAVWICAPLTIALYSSAGISSLRAQMPAFVRTMLFIPFGLVDGVYWTLGIEVSFYIIVYLLIRWEFLEHLDAMVGAITFLSLAFWITCYLAVAITASPTSQLHHIYPLVLKGEGFRVFQLLLVQHGAFFGLGTLIWLITTKGFTPQRLGLTAVAVIACILELNAQNGIIERAARLSFSATPAILVWIAATIFLILSIRYNAFIFRLLFGQRNFIRSVGLLTYPLYLVHNPVGVATALGLHDVGLPGDKLALVTGVAVAVAAALAISLWFEPVMRSLLKAWLARLTAIISTMRRMSPAATARVEDLQ